MPSITWWNRVEPRLRTDDVTGPLQARVRDPLWLLTRQWQMGEFRGIDAGSPAWVALSESADKLTTWQAPGGVAMPLTAAPLETQIAREPFTPDLATRIELGQLLSRLLATAGAPDDAFRGRYPIAETVVDPTDPAEALLRRACAGRTVDGVAAYQAAVAASPELPPAPAGVVDAFIAWVAATIGPIGDVRDASAWQPARLEYVATVQGSSATFQVHPDDRGLMDWSAFDAGITPVSPSPPIPPVTPAAAATTTTRSIIPAHVRFKGMPNARFWDFEDGTLDFGDVKPDKRDFARLALIEFMLLQSNDWFMLPVDVPVGAAYTLGSLVVHDVFGFDTTVERADRLPPIGPAPWTMFSTSGGAAGQTADLFLVPPSAGQALQTARAIEEVRFARDEMANMVWAIENVVEDAAGAAWPQRERDAALQATTPPAIAADPAVPLRYQIESRVPGSWIPLLPVSLDPVNGVVALELAAALADDGHTPVLPRGRILRPTNIAAGSPYQLPEEEIPRNGLRVQRLVCRSRWSDGSTHLWQMRRVDPGTGETSSGLRFDQALRNR